MRKVSRQDVGEVLSRIYAAEIPIRLEWVFDSGFVWVLVGTEDRWPARVPRLWVDEGLSGDDAATSLHSDTMAGAMDDERLLLPDWRERGSAKTIEDAVSALAEAISRHCVDSEFAQWWTARCPERN